MASRQPRKDLVPFALVKINSVRFSNRDSVYVEINNEFVTIMSVVKS